MTDVIHDLSFDQLAGEQVQTPTFTILGRSGTGQSNQVRFGVTIKSASLAPFLLGTTHGLGACADEASAHVGHGVQMYAYCPGNARIIRPVGRCQENACPLSLADGPLVRACRPLQFKPFGFRQCNEVLFRWHIRQLTTIYYPEEALVSLFFPSVIEKVLLTDVAATLSSLSYLVWTHPRAEEEFKRALRKTLFFGLSDGARMDTFRRLNEGLISNEQVLVAPQVNRGKWAEVLKKLRKALGDDAARFSRVFLIDDFVGSGKTLLRWDEEESEWDGKLLKFWKDGQTILEDGQTIFSSHLEPSWSLHVHHYIASWDGRRNAEEANARAQRERPAGTWFNQVKFTFGLVFNELLPLQRERDAAMWALTEEYYDPSIQTKSTAVGGEHVKRGFGHCGLPVILEHNTPNNSLALLWADTPGGEEVPAMRPLFRRAQRHW